MDVRGDWEAQWGSSASRDWLRWSPSRSMAPDGIAAAAAQLTEAGRPEEPLEAIDPLFRWLDRCNDDLWSTAGLMRCTRRSSRLAVRSSRCSRWAYAASS